MHPMCCHGFPATPGTEVVLFTCCATSTCQLGGDGCLLTCAVLFLLFPMVGELSRSCSCKECGDYTYGGDLQRKGWLNREGVLVHPSQRHIFPHFSELHLCTSDFSPHRLSLPSTYSVIQSQANIKPQHLWASHNVGMLCPIRTKLLRQGLLWLLMPFLLEISTVPLSNFLFFEELLEFFSFPICLPSTHARSKWPYKLPGLKGPLWSKVYNRAGTVE